MDGKVTIGSFDGCDALIMEQNIGEDIYYTYIYANNKELKELFIKDGVTAKASAGRTILEIQNFSMKQLSNNLLEFTCTDKKNQTASTIIGIRSM